MRIRLVQVQYHPQICDERVLIDYPRMRLSIQNEKNWSHERNLGDLTSFYANTWLTLKAEVAVFRAVFTGFRNGNDYRFGPRWRKTARFPDVVVHLQKNR